MSAGFTPGPWEAWKTPDEGVIAIRKRYTREDGSRVTEWPATCSCNTLPNLANARLIAAAPDLYEALEAVAEEYRHMHSVTDGIVRAALAKAKGEA